MSAATTIHIAEDVFVISTLLSEQCRAEELFFADRHTDHALLAKDVSEPAVQTYPHSAKRSAKSGAHPSSGKGMQRSGHQRIMSKERAQHTESHVCATLCAAEWNMACGASRALAAAKLSTNWRASSLNVPVPRATTTRLHLSPRKSSEYLLSFSSLAHEHTAPSVRAEPEMCSPIHCAYVHCQFGPEERREP